MQSSDFATAFVDIHFYLYNNAKDIFARCKAIYLHVIVSLIGWLNGYEKESNGIKL